MRTYFVLLIASILLTGCWVCGVPEDIGLDELPENQRKYPDIDPGAEWDNSREKEETIEKIQDDR